MYSFNEMRKIESQGETKTKHSVVPIQALLIRQFRYMIEGGNIGDN